MSIMESNSDSIPYLNVKHDYSRVPNRKGGKGNSRGKLVKVVLIH